MRVTQSSKARVDRQAWNEFAQQCSASFRCSYDALALWQRSCQMMSRLRLLEIHAADLECKIGQCAVAVGIGHIALIDGLQLLPEYAWLWEAAVSAVLEELGPGRYSYGSQWNLEPRREDRIACLPNVHVEQVTPVVLQAVDFERWDSWDSYFHQVSDNARRNARRARKLYPDLSIRVRASWATVLDVPEVVRLHVRMMRRKGIKTSVPATVLRLLLRLIYLGRHAVSAAIVSPSHGTLAVFSGVEFGINSYYLTGGSRAENGGAAWCLLLAILRRTHERTGGKGKFLMGCVQEGSLGWPDLLRSRAQCRVSEFQTSIVSFFYHGPPK